MRQIEVLKLLRYLTAQTVVAQPQLSGDLPVGVMFTGVSSIGGRPVRSIISAKIAVDARPATCVVLVEVARPPAVHPPRLKRPVQWLGGRIEGPAHATPGELNVSHDSLRTDRTATSRAARLRGRREPSRPLWNYTPVEARSAREPLNNLALHHKAHVLVTFDSGAGLLVQREKCIIPLGPSKLGTTRTFRLPL